MVSGTVATPAPYMLVWRGVMHAWRRSSVFMLPSSTCLVELTEMPFSVIALDDIEIVNLERVGFNLKNFDMAIVWKDFNKDVRLPCMAAHPTSLPLRACTQRIGRGIACLCPCMGCQSSP